MARNIVWLGCMGVEFSIRVWVEKKKEIKKRREEEKNSRYLTMISRFYVLAKNYSDWTRTYVKIRDVILITYCLQYWLKSNLPFFSQTIQIHILLI